MPSWGAISFSSRPTNVPDRVLRAIDTPTIDHRGHPVPEVDDIVRAVYGSAEFVERVEAFLRR